MSMKGIVRALALIVGIIALIWISTILVNLFMGPAPVAPA
jgi:hypothetical protein